MISGRNILARSPAGSVRDEGVSVGPPGISTFTVMRSAL